MAQGAVDRQLEDFPAGSVVVDVEGVEEGGWNLRIDVDGQVVIREHFNEWHRVERRRACLTLRLARLPNREAA